MTARLEHQEKKELMARNQLAAKGHQELLVKQDHKGHKEIAEKTEHPEMPVNQDHKVHQDFKDLLVLMVMKEQKVVKENQVTMLNIVHAQKRVVKTMKAIAVTILGPMAVAVFKINLMIKHIDLSL